jgi:5-methylcytosine-specific restriction protein A
MIYEKTKRITGRKLQAIRQEVLRANPLCVKCKAKGIVRMTREVDHIVPLYKGGKESPSNRQGLCTECHKEKTQVDLGSKITSGSDAKGMPTRHGHHWNT